MGVINFSLGLIKALFPIISAFFISVCMENIIKKFLNKGYSRKKATILSYVGLILVVIIFAIIFFPLLFKQLEVFVINLPSLIEKIEQLLIKVNINFNSNSIIDGLQIRIDKIIEYFSNSFSFLISFGIAFSGAFFISYDYDEIKNKIITIIPGIIKKETIYFFSKYFPFFSKYVYSLIIDSLITFAISFILFVMFRVEYALVGALIIAITNLIPFIGPIIGIVPLAIIGYSVSAYFAIVSIVVVLLVQLVESNFIQPLIFKNVIKLHPIEGLMGVLVFSYLFGAIGMIFSPLLVVAFKILFIEKYDQEQVTL